MVAGRANSISNVIGSPFGAPDSIFNVIGSPLCRRNSISNVIGSPLCGRNSISNAIGSPFPTEIPFPTRLEAFCVDAMAFPTFLKAKSLNKNLKTEPEGRRLADYRGNDYAGFMRSIPRFNCSLLIINCPASPSRRAECIPRRLRDR